MANQVVPNTDSRQVAVSAIAWEIVAKSYAYISIDDSEWALRTITNSFIEVYSAIWNESKLGEETER